MRSVRGVALAALAFTVLGASVASAQRRPAQRTATAEGYWELGTDAALSFGLDDPNTTVLSIPIGVIRAGYYMRPEWSIEPFLSFDWASVESVGSGTDYMFGVGVPYHFSTYRTRSQVYVRPFLAIVGTSFNPDGPGGGNSDSDVALGAGLGMKWPKLGGRMALRGEANVTRQFSDPGRTSLGLDFGVSFFTR
jgi:hypothetical protein